MSYQEYHGRYALSSSSEATVGAAVAQEVLEAWLHKGAL